ncbi:adenylate/guanylate cyclase domain-containing protein [Micromonospora noduli]|uniref:adenylate/guanylate cyclase domain-containing protein n=1 Tax=Micromonospora noduli TaxID=709876 RepID=UPI000DBFEB94|nr:adenylate/guanylate cyclase domain-containing protein [Micromonospora noduli]RAO08401.1 hypothetical protein GUI43_04050 [Micromonospora noduli]RAO35992.1 hypothetical protein ONO23_01937 [Micromonospora noduli]
MNSRRLDEIISLRESAATLQVVFLDIERYSRRRTKTQKAVVDEFTACIKVGLEKVAAENVTYAQTNDYNFGTDVIRIPTGDGAAICFSFDGLHDLHLNFALRVLEEVERRNELAKCELFGRDGWCNCHAIFNLRVGVAEGKTVVYRDINGNYNAAGNALNMAARVMNLMDPGQVGLTKEAYDQLVDMVDDPKMSERFVLHEDLSIKHGESISIYQYVDPTLEFLDSDEPSRAAEYARMRSMAKSMEGVLPFKLPTPGSVTAASMADFAEVLAEATVKLAALQNGESVDGSSLNAGKRPVIEGEAS